MSSFPSSMFTTAGPRARVASHPGASTTIAAPTQTATAGLSAYSGLPFQAPKSGASLQVLVGQATPLSSSSTSTFTITTAFVQTDLNGLLTTVPLTITSTDVTLVPVATTGSNSLASPKSTNATTVIIACGVVGVVLFLIAGIISCLFGPHRQHSRAFCCRPRSRSPLADPERSLSTIPPQPSTNSRRPRVANGTENSVVQRPESPKEICNPFDDYNAKRESWEQYIDRCQIGEHRLSYNTVSTRQLYISNQVNRAREKVAELEAMSTLLHSSTMSSSGESSGSQLGPGIIATAVGDEPVNGDDSESRRVQETLERAVQQIEGLNNRIRELEMHRMQLSAHPPDYFE
ncbi:hypothetical protein B0H14DRAFT_2858919 [Mycena olivaceomarginata]|nr:hypothetical protein B0H14DRAFT_2858919 [Mycena olivaceomarginata]